MKDLTHLKIVDGGSKKGLVCRAPRLERIETESFLNWIQFEINY